MSGSSDRPSLSGVYRLPAPLFERGNSLKRLLLALSVLAVSTFLLIPPAAASHGTFVETWPAGTGTISVYLSENNTWTTAQENAVAAAIDEINTQTASGVPTLIFHSSPLKEADTCTDGWASQGYPAVIEKVGYGHLGWEPNGAKVRALTQPCQNFAHTALASFWLQIETPSSIYWGADNPEANGDIGARGILVHELIHGFGMNHFGSNTAQCVNSWEGGTVGNFHTMCPSPWENSAGYDQFNRFITLESHDISSLEAAY